MFSPARLRVIYTYGLTTDPTTHIAGCPVMILYLVRPSAGGIQEHLRLLLEHFGQHHPVKLAGPRSGTELLSLQPDQFLTISGGFTPASDVCAWWQCYRLLRLLQPSLLHIHGFKAALVGCPAARLARVPALVTVHNYPAHRVAAAVLPALSRLNGASEIRFIAVSRALARELSAWGIPAANIKVIHNGIDAAPFEQAGRQRSYIAGDSEIVVGTVARMAPQKGLSHLLQAAVLLVRRFPRLRFILAGDGPDLNSLKELAAALGLSERISFPGYCRDLPSLLGQIDIFVLPSLTEGLAITLLEAQASGCAVVASRVGGVPEVIEHRRTGILVPPASPGALADAVAALIENPALRRSMALAGRERVRKHFTVEQMLKQTGLVYAEMLADRRCRL